MKNIQELIVEYHRELNEFISSGFIPGDSFFEMEDKILQYFNLLPPDTFYYQSALQLKMAKIHKDSDSESILRELSDYLIPLRQRIDNHVWICNPKLIEITSLTEGMYDMLIEYEELGCDVNEELIFWDHPASLHFEEECQLRILLEAYSYDADIILAELDAMRERCRRDDDDCIDLKNIRHIDDPVCKCMIMAIIDTYMGDVKNLVPPLDVVEVCTGYAQLEEAIAELSKILNGEEVQAIWLPELKAHVLKKESAGLYDIEFSLVLCAFFDALCSIQSDILNGRYFVRQVHHYLLRHRFNLNVELIDRFIESIFSFAKTKKTLTP